MREDAAAILAKVMRQHLSNGPLAAPNKDRVRRLPPNSSE
jgi:hypothetical protein